MQRNEASFAHALCKTLYMWCVFCLCIQEDATQVKRSSSPPRGAPKKRTAFIDITNVSTFFFLFFFKGCDLGFNSRIRASISTQRDIFIAKMVHQESGLNFLTVDVTFRRISWAPSFVCFFVCERLKLSTFNHLIVLTYKKVISPASVGLFVCFA